MSVVYDFLIVGSGIIGLSTASELLVRYPKAKIALLDKESYLGAHASGRNSGVLHSGIYYGSDTLKAKVCSRGAARMMEFAQEHDIPYRQSGKVIIATSKQDLPVVDQLLANARDNHINAKRLNESEIRDIEPNATPYETGIYSPDTAVIDSRAVLDKLCELITSKGASLFLGLEVIDINTDKNYVKTSKGNYYFGQLFNCAGAYADKIAKKFGLAGDLTLIPFKGLYYKLRPERAHLVKANIYPVPDISLPFLGVHLTRLIDGNVYVGPTAIPALGRENYKLIKGIKVGEGLRITRDLARLYVSNNQGFRHLVHTEARKLLKYYIVAAAKKLVTELDGTDLIPSNKVGIRPQLVNMRTRKLELDYIVEQTPTSVHVLNSISPAFTSAFAFAEMLVDKIE